ncbi:MAG: hypothetical protein OWR52_08500 [Acidibacillus sp.]|uniref:Uncharacterized protein n=1 Tax=Sulfoacidibacillus ferrooxidans TaxID=2005001 RepID=A0A9X1V7Y9_9BACL|nr:hypothetical protein [Sulfoacidibacillus ferrooxidans]MCI0182895.1 hypothetical protein [Sulfoacidibacillus ferrooxidans]MCY0893532.1 hypothetical protein [Acidibacillus sp.]
MPTSQNHGDDDLGMVIEDPEMATTYGSNGRQYVEHHLSWAMLVRTWLDQLRVD